MTEKEEYINAKTQLELLIKKLDAGKNVDAELNSVSNIIEKYEENNFPMD